MIDNLCGRRPDVWRPTDMALAVGTPVGSYEIAALIGAGGMGEVYRARDPKLRRDVALKILPEVFAADPDRRARFTREAHVLASLNHPHIASGRWVAYVSNESGSNEVYVRASDGSSRASLVSSGGGAEPVWSRSGQELFYRSGDRMMALGVNLLDNQDLEVLGDAAAKLNRWEFMLTIAPVPVTGGTGFPLNAIAMF